MGNNSKLVVRPPKNGIGFVKGEITFATFLEPAAISPAITPISSYKNSDKSAKNSFPPPSKNLASNLDQGLDMSFLNNISPALLPLGFPSPPGTKTNSPSGYNSLN